MRRLLTIPFLCILFLSVFSQGIVVIRYFANKNFIATVLCENKEKPMLHCDGKCVLAKKLARQEKQQEDSGIHFKEKFEVPAGPEPCFYTFRRTCHLIESLMFPNHPQSLFTSAFIEGVDHPPQG